MNFSQHLSQLSASLFTNILALLFLPIAIWWPRTARLVFFLLFAGASWFNIHTAVTNPELYQQFADMAVPLYAGFIRGWFNDHTPEVIISIAILQALIAVGMLLKGTWLKLALLGIIIFLIAIAPLGKGAAFPFSLIVSAAAFLVYKKDKHNYLWKN